jgi:mono/diheme cytochrome c family protein
LTLPLALAACADKRPPADDAPADEAALTAQPSAEAMAEAKETFGARCTPCHGPMGEGDGPASAGLTPRPRNFSDAAWQKEVSDEHIERIIQYGGAAVGRSPAMPPNPDLTGKPEVVQGLRAHIRSLGNGGTP